MQKIFEALSLAAAAWLLAFAAPVAAQEQREPSWLVCSAPWQLAPTLDQVDENNPFQLLELDASILTEGCLYRSFEGYPQRQVEVNWMYHRDPLLFDIAKVTVVEDGRTIQYWAVPRTIHTSDMADEVPGFVLVNPALVGQSEDNAGVFVRWFYAVMKHPSWVEPES
tara:strand:+ start:1025 stop:1525 length:501 start_codon:yes stop_codon:yes gene_type:complete